MEIRPREGLTKPNERLVFTVLAVLFLTCLVAMRACRS